MHIEFVPYRGQTTVWSVNCLCVRVTMVCPKIFTKKILRHGAPSLVSWAPTCSMKPALKRRCMTSYRDSRSRLTYGAAVKKLRLPIQTQMLREAQHSNVDRALPW